MDFYTPAHVLEPERFGDTGAYIDLGAFCRTGELLDKRGEIERLHGRYKALYARAYGYLAAARAAAPEKLPGLITDAERETAVRRALSAAERELPRRQKGAVKGRISRRFISAITCRGTVFLEDTLHALCGRIYAVDGRLGLEGPYLNTLAREAEERGLDAILCQDPLSPAEPEALLLPGLSLGFLAVKRGRELAFEPFRRIRLDSLADPERLRAARARLRSDERLRAELMAAAVESLASAKEVHDRLEALYRPHIDFPALTRRAQSEAEGLLK